MAQLKIGKLTLGICQTNCYFVYDAEKTNAAGQPEENAVKEVIFFDPADRGDYIYETLKKANIHVAGILLTHAHFDHIWGAEKLRELSGCKLYALDEERVLCENARVNSSAQAGRACTIEPDGYLKDGQEITIADMTCKVIATPGHTVGSCCYYFAEAGFLISGDTLFEESVGRTDLSTGSSSAIVRSIREKLFVLPDETIVYPGHGGSTKIGYEKEYNPFCG